MESDHLDCIVGRIGEGRSKITGHLNEVGFIVSGITKNGLSSLSSIRRMVGHVLLSQCVKVLSKQKDISGVIKLKTLYSWSCFHCSL
ncbi:hypothetical protein [Halalkalibacter sp. APA_J-10(15)]|uniref:hypothetical protein n=1 Tax=Halalkalibacter sp. APA_J-10(15) TaxID=2933805 RepID=UPI0034D5406C